MRFILLLISTLLLCEKLSGQSFENVALQAGVDHVFGFGLYGGGVSFADFNQDGFDDLTLTSQYGDPMRFYLNVNGQFLPYPQPLIFHFGESKHPLWADADNDGDLDLFVTGFQFPSRFFRNEGDLLLIDATFPLGFQLEGLPTFGAAWGDINNDGWLDLYVVNRAGDVPNFLYVNDGNGSFTELAEQAGVQAVEKEPFAVAFLDYDRDGWQDIFLAVDHALGNVLYKNQGDGTFVDVSEYAGAGHFINAMCVSVGDYDNDLDLDIYATNTDEGNILLQNMGDGTFFQVATQSGVGFFGVGWGASWLDVDNDADLDLYVCSSDFGFGTSPVQNTLYENLGSGQFGESLGMGFVGDTMLSYSSAVADFDHNGYPDIAVSNGAGYPFQLWKNSGGDNHWLKVKLTGTASNRDGVGTFVEVYTDGEAQMRYSTSGTGFLGQNSKTLHVGLDGAIVIDSIRIFWLSGIVDRFYNIPVDQTLQVTEGETLLPTTTTAILPLTGITTFPNPARKSNVHLTFKLDRSMTLAIGVYHLSGKVIQTWTTNNYPAGVHEIPMDFLDSGCYLIRFQADSGEIFSEKIIVLKE